MSRSSLVFTCLVLSLSLFSLVPSGAAPALAAAQEEPPGLGPQDGARDASSADAEVENGADNLWVMDADGG